MASNQKKLNLKLELEYNVSEIRNLISDEEREKLDTFRTMVLEAWPDMTPEEDLWLTEATLCRYLRARDWKRAKALEMIIGTLKWRREYKPDSITADDVDVELNNKGKMYRNGFDKYKRAVLYMKPRKDNTLDGERTVKVRNLVYQLNKAISASERNDREKVVIVIDFKDNPMTSVSGIKNSLDVLSILSNHYPERLVISPLLDEVTKAKIVMGKAETLSEWIPASELDAEYGGENPFVYDYDQHKYKEDTEFPPITEERVAKLLKRRDKKKAKSESYKSNDTKIDSNGSKSEKIEGTKKSEDKIKRSKSKKLDSSQSESNENGSLEGSTKEKKKAKLDESHSESQSTEKSEVDKPKRSKSKKSVDE